MGRRSIVNPLNSRRHALQRWIGAGLDLLFPIQCAGCSRSGEIWCEECNGSISRISSPICIDCGRQLEQDIRCPTCSRRKLDLQVRSYARYGGRLSQALLHLKYRPDKQLATVMGSWLHALYLRSRLSGSLVVPVPLGSDRLRERGFNQAAMLADAFGALAGLEIDSRHLIRTSDTRTQVGLDPRERWNNVKSAFSAHPQKFVGSSVIVVDDLFTTGATLSACASALRAAGAQSVIGITVARA